MSTIRDHHLPVTRTARYYTLDPTEPPHEVWFVLHGYGQLAAFFVQHFEAVQDGRRLIVAPEALSRFYLADHGRVGASWMTKEDRLSEIEDYLAYLDAVHDRIFADVDRDHVAVHVLGYSQGTATASRWVARGHVEADRLTLWGGDLAHDLNLTVHGDVFRSLILTFVVGSEDDYLTPERLTAQETLLIDHSIPYRLRPFPGGHRMDAAMLQALAAGA